MDGSETYKDGKFLTGKGKKFLVVSTLVIGFILLFSGGMPQHLIGWQTTPGSFFEKRHYTASIYVLVSEDSSSTKLYREPATIQRINPCDPANADDGNPNGCSSSLAYQIDTLYWPDGGVLTFDNIPCYIGQSHASKCKDDDGQSYGLTLTNAAAPSGAKK